MNLAHIDRIARLAGVIAAAVLVACGGDDDAHVSTPPQVNPAVSGLLSSVDAIGPGGAALLSNNPADADLALQSNLAGGTVQLRFSCAGCNISVSAAGTTVGARRWCGSTSAWAPAAKVMRSNKLVTSSFMPEQRGAVQTG